MTKTSVTDFPAYNRNLNAAHFIDQLDAPQSISLVPPSFMHELAREGDLLSAEIIYETGHDLDTPNEEGRRPLHEAAFFGHIDMVRFFVENGAMLDAAVQPFGHTALYLAVQQSRYDIVKWLVKAGADFGVTDRLMGTGLLHIAAAKGDMEMAGILIASGIDVFYEDRKGMTARDVAACHGHKLLERALLKVMEHQYRYAA